MDADDGGELGRLPRGDGDESGGRLLIQPRSRRRDAERFADIAGNRGSRRHWRKEAAAWSARETDVQIAYHQITGPEGNRVDWEISELKDWAGELRAARRERSAWFEQHPEASLRLHALELEQRSLGDLPEIHHGLSRSRGTTHELDPGPNIARDLDLGMDSASDEHPPPGRTLRLLVVEGW